MPGQSPSGGARFSPCCGIVLVPELSFDELEPELPDASDDELESFVCAWAPMAPPPINAALRPNTAALVLIHGFMCNHLLRVVVVRGSQTELG
jgi:hypothetical protein